MAAEMTKTLLTAVIPISNYQSHSDNVEAVLKRVALFGVEVILVLDNQPKQAFDNLLQIVTAMKIEARVIQVNSNSPGGSRNSGMQLATRKWIAFWDCDDFPVIEETIRLMQDAETSHANIAVGNYEVEDLRTHKVVIKDMNLRSPQIGIGLNPGIWRMIFQNEVLTGIKFPELSMGEDQVFIQRVINQETRIIFRNYVVYRYRTGVSSQLTSNFKWTRDIVPAHELAVAEYNPRGKLRKMAITMLFRQELTILKYPGSPLKEKLLLCLSLLKKIIKRPELLIELVLLKFHNLREKGQS